MLDLKNWNAVSWTKINLTEDCLRLYRMPETRGAEVKEYGIFKAVDLKARWCCEAKPSPETGYDETARTPSDGPAPHEFAPNPLI